MNDELFGERRKAHEESYFNKRDEHLRERMRARAAREARRRDLSAVTGIDDDWVLEALLARGIDARSVEGFALLPLAEVAWADGRVEAAERAAALEAAQRAASKRRAGRCSRPGSRSRRTAASARCGEPSRRPGRWRSTPRTATRGGASSSTRPARWRWRRAECSASAARCPAPRRRRCAASKRRCHNRSMPALEHRTILVTGITDASSLALHCAQQLRREGRASGVHRPGADAAPRRVVGTVRRPFLASYADFRRAVADAFGDAALALPLDVTLDGSLADTAAALRERGIRLDGVLHSIAMDKTIRGGEVKPLLAGDARGVRARRWRSPHTR